MKRRLMAEQWDQFARTIIPRDAPAIQKIEMRRAFYAGAHGILFRVIEVFSPETEPTAEDLKIMEDLYQELQDFAKDVSEGRA